MSYPFDQTTFTNNDPNNPIYQIAGIPFKKSRKGLPKVAYKKDTGAYELLFLGLSFLVGVLTEGLGTLVFDALLIGGESALATEGVAMVVAGATQSVFEVGGQLGI